MHHMEISIRLTDNLDLLQNATSSYLILFDHAIDKILSHYIINFGNSKVWKLENLKLFHDLLEVEFGWRNRFTVLFGIGAGVQWLWEMF